MRNSIDDQCDQKVGDNHRKPCALHGVRANLVVYVDDLIVIRMEFRAELKPH